MSDDFNNNLTNEPVTPPVPETDNSQPAFDYQPPQVEIPQAPAFETAPTQVNIPAASTNEVSAAPTEAQPVYTFGQQPVQAQVPQPTPYQPAPQGYQSQQAPYQPTAQGYQPQQAPFQPTAQGYQPQQAPYQPGEAQQNQTHSTGYYQYTPVNPAMVNAQNQTDGFAIASLILGIVGICSCCTFIPSILGLIFGIISKSSNDGTRPTGVSTAGIITSAIGLVLNLLFFILMLAE